MAFGAIRIVRVFKGSLHARQTGVTTFGQVVRHLARANLRLLVDRPSKTQTSKAASANIQSASAESRRWGILASLFVIGMVLFGAGVLDFGVFFNPLRESFSWSNERTSSLLVMLLVVSAAVSPVVGWLLDRFEAQRIMLVGAMFVVVAFVIASRAHTFGIMALAFLTMGVGLTFSTIVPSQVVIAHWFEERLQALAFEIVIGSGMALGGILVVPATAAIVQTWGWRTAFLAMAGCVVVVVVPLLALVVRGREVRPDRSKRFIALPGLDISEGFRRIAVWLLLLSYLAYGFAQGVPIAHLIPLLMKLGYSPQFAAANVAEYHVIAFFACLLAGFFGDRIGSKLPSVVCAIFIMLAISLAAVLDARRTVMRMLFVVCFGFGVAAPGGLLAKLLVQTVGSKSFGFFSGMCSFVLTLGFAASPLVGGLLMDMTGSYRSAFWLSAVLALLAGAATLGVSVRGRSWAEPVTLKRLG